MDIIASSRPAYLTIPVSWLAKFLYDPALAAWVFFRVELDAFQSYRLKQFWFTPESWDSSGYGSGKTLVDWLFLNLSAVLIPDTVCLFISQTFQSGKDNFWKYYNELGTDLWRAQLGRMDIEGEEDGKSRSKEPGNWKQHFKSRSVVMMPAPNFLQESKNLAGMDVNRLLIDEFNKVLASTSGLAAVTQQLLGRVRRRTFNKHHPVWGNKTVRTSTAELGSHPAFVIHQAFEKEMLRGNPDFTAFAFNYKNFSSLPSHTGKSFREEFRDDKKINAMKLSLSDDKVLSEMFGIWARSSSGWYSETDIEAAYALGRDRGLEIIMARSADAEGEKAVYFLGADWARSATVKADDCALVIGRALPVVESPSDHEGDWRFDFISAAKVADGDAEKISARVHQLHQAYGFAYIVGDAGGGGDFVTPQLKKPRQVWNEVPFETRPIALTGDNTVVDAYFILSVMKRTDDGIRELWPELATARGDDMLKYFANLQFRAALQRQTIGWPRDHNYQWAMGRSYFAGWPEEKMWASRLLTLAAHQCQKYGVLTNDDGTWKTTSNGGLLFTCEGKDDFHDASRNCYTAFRVWLKGHGAGWAVSDENAALCRSR